MSAPGYPPEPWDLRGDLHATVLLVPVDALPPAVRDGLPPGHRLVRIGGRAVVGVAWVDYGPGGVLSYRELMSLVLVRRGPRLRPSITHIWVDSPTSRDGGRALWSIPKDLADFAFAATPGGTAAFAAHEPDSAPIATATVRPGLRLPGRWPVRFAVAQRDLRRGDRAVVSPVRARARLELTRVTLDAPHAGPLGFLRGRRPGTGLSLRNFRMRFGRRAARPGTRQIFTPTKH